MSDDDIGYKKPPKKHQFKPGESGNKRGRPKGSKNLTTVAYEAFNKKLRITEDGKPRSVTKLEVGMAQLANKVASGDLKAFSHALPLMSRIEERQEAKVSAGINITSADKTTMESIRQRMQQYVFSSPAPEEPTFENFDPSI